jgi:hypothetical protein
MENSGIFKIIFIYRYMLLTSARQPKTDIEALKLPGVVAKLTH